MGTKTPALLALQDMALFVAVAQALSFTRASETSGIPVATLSRRIAKLERRVGVRLFERSTRRLSLTEPGKRYLERCERIVQEANIAHEVLRELAERPSGHLRVSMPVEFGLIYVAPIVDDFARHYPDITLELDLSPRPADQRQELVDIRIRLGEINDHSLVARRLGSIARLLYASPTYLARRGVPQQPADLGGHDCILQSYMTPPTQWQLVSGSEVAEAQVQGRFSTNNVTMTLLLAEQGRGIAIVSPTMARAACDAGRLRRVLEDWSFTSITVHALTTSRLLPARVRAFIDFLGSRLTM